MLSGFLITQSWIGDPDLHAFTVKRALRLVPALLAALVLGALVVGPLMTTSSVLGYLAAPSTWEHFGGVALHRHLASPLLFADNPVPHQLNASLWSLRYEILCYALVALIGVWRGVHWTVAAAVVLATALAAQVVLGRLGAPAAGVATTLAELVGCFFAGAALYALRDRVPFSLALAAGAAAALAAAALIGGVRLVFPLAGTYLLLFLGCWRGPCRFRASGASETSPTASTSSRTPSSRRSCSTPGRASRSPCSSRSPSSPRSSSPSCPGTSSKPRRSPTSRAGPLSA